MEKVRISEENVMTFYEAFGSNDFELQSTTLEKYGELKLNIYFKSIGFVTTVTSVIGIIAGFGFTAFSFIESRLLFFVGEAILFYGIFRGLKWAQDVYTAEFKALEAEMKKHVAHYEIRNKAFGVVYDQLLSANHEINQVDIENLNKVDRDGLILFKPSEEENKPLVIYSKEVYMCLLVGTMVLFSSFFIFDLVKFVSSIVSINAI
jgi:hypothetical protein